VAREPAPAKVVGDLYAALRRLAAEAPQGPEEGRTTAWLEIMSGLAAAGRHAEMDFRNLAEYLADMARRDRREVKSRLVALLANLLR
jgi:hypothetical protein